MRSPGQPTSGWNTYRVALLILLGPFTVALLGGGFVGSPCDEIYCPGAVSDLGVYWISALTVAVVTFIHVARRAGPLRGVITAWLLTLSIAALFISATRFYKEDVVGGAFAAAIMMVTSIAYVRVLPPPEPPTARSPRKAKRSQPAPGEARGPLVLGRPLPPPRRQPPRVAARTSVGRPRFRNA